MLKIELHAHTADDPVDAISYSTKDLIDHLARAGYDALAVTLHDRQLDIRPLKEYAADRGIVLIPGVERTIEGRHVLLLNFKTTDDVRTFDDLARLKSRDRGLVIAPHPFFPAGASLRGRLEPHADLFDAVERNAMYTSTVDFNRRAERWAARHDKPMVGAGDIHRLWQTGTTYSLVDGDRQADAICAAIAAGQVQMATRPLTWPEATRTLSSIMLGQLIPRTGTSGTGERSLNQSAF